MSNWILFRFFKLTKGRPMFFVETLFIDRVTGKTVCHYRDRFGKSWMATSRWGWDRVER